MTLLVLFMVLLLGAHAQLDIGQDTIIPNQQHGVAVGERGHVYSTHNGGFAWIRQRLINRREVDLNSAFVFDDTSAVAVGGDCNGQYGGTTCGIFFREAGMSTVEEYEWVKARLDVDGALGNNLRRLSFVSFCSHSLGFVVGEQGSILRSTNGGMNWGADPSGTLDALQTIHCSGEDLVLVAGSNGIILRSTTKGETWTLPSALPDPSSSTVALLMQEARFGFAVGDRVYSTTNSGISWVPTVINATLPIRAAYVSQGGNSEFSTAIVSDRGGTEGYVLQLLRPEIRSGRLHDGSTIQWTQERISTRLAVRGVALAGLPNNCTACDGILMSGQAVTTANTGCARGKVLTCGSRPDEDRNFRCCGPLQFKPNFAQAFATAIYTPSPAQQTQIREEQEAAALLDETLTFPDPAADLPVGCDGVVDCAAMAGVAFSTGRTPAPRPGDGQGGPDDGGGPAEPEEETVSLVFHVDVKDYTVFQLALFVDNIVALLSIPYTPPASSTEATDGLLEATLVLRSDNATGFDKDEAVRRMVGIAQASSGKGSDICDTGTRKLVVAAGDWGGGADVEVDCEQKGLPQATAIVVIVLLSVYGLMGVLLAFLFSLPKYWTVPKHLPTAYGLWFFFGILGIHRFYLKVPKSGLLYMFTGGIFGLGWLADAVLTPFLYNAACFDQGRENTGYISGRIRNAARPNFVTRREALNMMAEIEHGGKREGDEDEEHRAATGGEIDPGQLVEELCLETAHPGPNYVSPLLYPSAAMMSSEQYLRSQELNQAQRGYTTEHNDGEADGTDGYISVVA